MADAKISALTNYTNPDGANDVIPIVDVANSATKKITRNNFLGLTSAPVGLTDSQTLTGKTLTAPIITSPIFSGTITGTYTLGGTPTFPAAVVTLTGSQTLTGKTLTSPIINGPTITNASITADAYNGFTSANTGTIFGIPITASKLPGTSLANASVGPTQLATGAQTAIVLTSESTTSTSYVDLTTTTDTVTVIIGSNGLALVSLVAQFGNSIANAYAYVTFVASGANTIAANDTNGIIYQSYAANALTQAGNCVLVTGLAAGSTVFKMKYKVATGGGGSGTGTFLNRKISVVPL